MKVKISACLVVRNEEKRIKKCLESIKDLVDEIVVIHDGPCRDQTIEICKEFGARVYVGEYTGNPEFHRIELLKKAKNDWILQLDADEALSEELRDEISKLRFDKDGYLVKVLRKNSNFKKYHLRLYHRKKIKFLGLIHHGPELLNPLNSQKLFNPIWHFKEPESIFSDRWRGIQAKEYLKDFSEVSKYNWPETDWPKNIKFRRNHPFLALILAPIRSFFHFTRKYDLKVGIEHSLSSFLLGWKIIELKYKKYLYFLKFRVISFFLDVFDFGKKIPRSFSWKPQREAYVILTFDDEIKEEYIKLIDYLNVNKIKATFFLPFSKLNDWLLEYLISFDHEIGWHGYYHQRCEMEDDYQDSLKKSKNLIEKLGVVSARLPFLSRKEAYFKNLKLAGLKIDSSYPTFRAFKDFQLKYGLYEMPFLRLPDFGSMDLSFKKYSDLKNQILRRIEPGKFLVIGFHIYKQFEYFEEFKGLVQELLKKKVKFIRLKDVLEIAKRK